MRRLAALIGVLASAAPIAVPLADAAPARATKHVRTFFLPEYVKSTEVAIAPGGVPWFGLSFGLGGESAVARVESGRLSIDPVAQGEAPSWTTGLQFDEGGDLWFVRNGGADSSAIVRRAPDGALTEVTAPDAGDLSSVTVAPDGEVWFMGASTIGRLSPAGAISEIPLASGSAPRSAVVGPDGAIWFTEPEEDQIGRVTTPGELTLLPVGKGVDPREIVTGSDGALWFSESGTSGHHGRTVDRIGRMTTNGEVTQFRVPFGEATESVAAAPNGVIWFSTEEGQISSISTSGTVGPHRCATARCNYSIGDIARARSGAIWFTAQNKFCKGCGGGADLIIANEGTLVGKVPAGALKPPSLP